MENDLFDSDFMFFFFLEIALSHAEYFSNFRPLKLVEIMSLRSKGYLTYFNFH